MGKFGSPQIGVFSPDGSDYDDPNLNKCINCGALFQGKICPICKTECAPEMMAGARKAKKESTPPERKSGGMIVLFYILLIVGLIFFISMILTSHQQSGDSSSAQNNFSTFETKQIDKTEYYAIYGYETLARYPDDYKGTKGRLSGKVLQTVESEGSDWVTMRFATDNTNKHVFYCTYHKKMLDVRLLEGDMIVVYGVANGLKTYESSSGQQITIPKITVDAIELAE